MRANQLRLWLASMAYVLLAALRRIGLKTTRLARATAGTIRLKLLKVGAPVRISVRRVTVARGSSAALPSGGSGLWPDGLRPPLAARPGARPGRPHRRGGALTTQTAHGRHRRCDAARGRHRTLLSTTDLTSPCPGQNRRPRPGPPIPPPENGGGEKSGLGESQMIVMDNQVLFSWVYSSHPARTSNVLRRWIN
jgi:hypothetical protein